MHDIQVTVVYASIDEQVSVELCLSPHANVAMALRQSGLLHQFAELQLESLVVGIYGRKVSLDASLQHRDRIEIYRSLSANPMQARRRRERRIG